MAVKDAYELLALRNNKYQEIHAALFAFRQAQVTELDAIISRIRNSFKSKSQTESILADLYEDLDQAIIAFHSELLDENLFVEIGDNSIILTAHKLEEIIPIILDPDIALDKKYEATQGCYNYTRNGTINGGTKLAIGSVIGAALVLAGCIALVVCTGGLGLGVAAALIKPFVIASTLMLTALGGAFGMGGGLIAMFNQRDSRGKEVNSSLNTLIRERNKIYHPHAAKTVTPELNKQGEFLSLRPR